MMRESNTEDGSSCDRSRYCSRLLDDLAKHEQRREPGSEQQRLDAQVFLSSTRDWQDDRLIEQMRAHLPGCQGCAEALVQEQQLRAEQRALFHSRLLDNESAVPSTTGRILDALHQQQPETYSRKRLDYMLPELFISREPPEFDASSYRSTEPLSLNLSRRWLRSGVTLATVAALIFAVIGVFGQMLSHSPTSLSVLPTKITHDQASRALSTMISHAPSLPPAANSPSPLATSEADAFQGWNSFVLITAIPTALTTIRTYNYLNGDQRQAASSSGYLRFDGVASSGKNMLYQVVKGERTLFFTLDHLPGSSYFFQLDEHNALNAIWMPDSIDVLIATRFNGVIEVNTQTGDWQTYMPALRTAGLKFYRNGYLYFLGGSDRSPDTLYRINVTSNEVWQVTGHSSNGNFWLSPDSLTVYYRNNSPNGLSAIYADSSDGSKRVVLRSDGVPIGYAPDDSLVVMRVVHHAFQVVRLGVSIQQDQVLMANVAPGAVSLCDPSIRIEIICDTTNVALAPLAHALVVIASYPDGSRKVWSDDLTTGKQSVLMTLTGTQSAMVPGWDRIAVA